VLLAREILQRELGRRAAGPRLEIRGRRGERSRGAQRREQEPKRAQALISREAIA
jgi:hypothetical protein